MISQNNQLLPHGISIKISGIEIHHPSSIRNNDYYIEKFKDNDRIKDILNKLGRLNRFVISEDEENALTLSTIASQKLFKNLNLKNGDVDIIIFTSTTVEYLSPTNALMLHSYLGIKKECMCFDMNANCLGMLLALEQASVLLKSNTNYKRALVVGTDCLSKISSENTPIPSSIVGDAAAAMIVEKVFDNSNSGMVDILYQTDSSFKDTIVYPPYGFSDKSNIQNNKFHWDTFSGLESVQFATSALDTLLKKHNIKQDEISCFFLSQFTKYNIEILQKNLDISWSKIEYIGDQYGYTGVNSPFIAYHSRLKKKLLNEGDLVVFWSLGAGYQTSLMIWRI